MFSSSRHFDHKKFGFFPDRARGGRRPPLPASEGKDEIRRQDDDDERDERALDYVLGSWSRGPVMSKMADARFPRAEMP